MGKKAVKMDLGSFLADDSIGGGSWADAEVDLNTIGVNVSSTAAPIGGSAAPGGSSNSFSSFSGGFEERRERKEFPVPDAPPYRARVGNLPWEVDEAAVVKFFEDRMQLYDIVSDVSLPMDRDTGKLKGFAFVTFAERDLLEDALALNMSDFNGRRVFVNVAAPLRSEFDGDWKKGGALGSSMGGRESRPEVDLDWGSARNTHQTLPPRERFGDRFDRERGDRGERPPRREEPDLDWGSARNTHQTLPPRERFERGDRFDRERGDRGERPPRKEEPDLDWGSARNTHQTLPPRERFERSNRERVDRGDRPPRKEEADLDWGSARGTPQTYQPPRERSNRTPREKKPEPELEWTRGSALHTRSKPSTPRQKSEDKPVEEQVKPKKPSFSVLAVEDSDEEETAPTVAAPVEAEATTGLESATADLSVAEPKEDGWEVVGK